MLIDKRVAATMAFILFMAACFRLPIELGKGRLLLIAIFQLSCIALFAAILWSFNRWVAVFLIFAFWSRTYPVLTDESEEAFRLVMYGCVLFSAIFLATANGHDHYFLDTMCTIAFANGLCIVIQRLNITDVWVGNPSGLMYNPNESAMCFAMCLPACLRPGRKWFLVPTVAGVLISRSVIGPVAIGASIIYWAFMCWRPWVTIIGVGIGIALYVFFCDVPTIRERWDWWTSALRLFKNRWWSGCGLGNWKASYPYLMKSGLMPQGAIRLHNDFLQGGMEMGAGFWINTLGFLGQIVMNIRRLPIIFVMGLIAVCVCSFINSVFRMNAINAMIAVTWFAMIAARIKEGDSLCRTML